LAIPNSTTTIELAAGFELNEVFINFVNFPYSTPFSLDDDYNYNYNYYYYYYYYYYNCYTKYTSRKG
jgi:hypothetical protein